MTRKESLSQDIDVIKEVEELRLKQKLLINSLKSTNQASSDNTSAEINSKLEFLVNIFKEANTPENQEEDIEKKLEELTQKIDSLENLMTKKFEKFSSNSVEAKKETSKEKIANSVPSEDSPPVPEFKAENVDDEKKEVSNEEPKKKKKGWFS